ncbi:MAG: GNAT family N-acetyltransferase [Desulfobacteraceae bacterium]|jgi:GNAT superfamily N-acetyltransferase|nr:GNAT family N-acetyltransferase [Desulfobacteraceae bacterium]
MIPFETRVGYVPGVIGRIAELHARYYSKNWNFGSIFEAKVASELSNFIRIYDDAKDRIWSLWVEGSIEGSLVIDGTSETNNSAHLRWFIVSDRMQGKGAGNHLMEQAVSFCRETGFNAVYLWTFHGLAAARHLYEKYGFRLQEEHQGRQWGTTVREQKFERTLRAP